MKRLLFTYIATTLLLLAAPFAFWSHQRSNENFGAFNPTGGSTYRLQSSLGSSDTSVTLSSFKEPVSNIPYTMTYLNSSVEFATIEPQSSSKEFVSFTGITQNSDGTATLTGLTRGLGFSYPYTASTTLQEAHPAQAIFILSNPPQLYNQYANRNNNDTILGTWNFGALPTSTQTCTTGSQFCTKSYIDALSIQGAATSTETNIGLVQLANQVQVGSSTASSTAGGPLVIENKFATTTPGTLCTTNALRCVVATNFGKISQAFYDLTASWSFTGAVSIAANSSNKLTLNSVAYVAPTSQGTASTTLLNDSAGNLVWSGLGYLVLASTTYPTWTGSVGSTTVASATIPANTLTNGSRVRAKVYFSSWINNANNFQFDAAFGGLGTSTILTGPQGNIVSPFVVWTVDVIGLGGSSEYILSTIEGATTTALAGGPATAITVDSTQAQTFKLFAQKASTATLQPVFSTIEVLR